MSVQTEAPAAAEWRLLSARDIEWDPSVPEAQRKGWQYLHASGLKTDVCQTPGEAVRAKNELIRTLEEGAAGEAAPPLEEAVEATEETAPGLPDAAADEGDDSRHDAEAADTAGPDDEVEEGEEQPDGFPNPGAGFSRGLGQEGAAESGHGVTFVGRASLFEGQPAPLMQQMHPSRIKTHPSTLMRAGGLDAEHVDDLAATLLSGRPLPPVDVFFDGADHWLADGNHRHAAAVSADRVLDVSVHKGTLRDAILFAVRANARHGLKRTNDDKRLAVVTLLSDPEWGRQSDTSVAEMADVTQPFVGKVQAWLVRLLPVLDGNGTEDPSDVPDEEFAERAGAPAGLVSAVRGLTDVQLATLAQNVMARTEARVARDGKTVSVERPPVEEPPYLFTPDEAPQKAPAEALERADEAEEGADEDSPSPAPAAATAPLPPVDGAVVHEAPSMDDTAAAEQIAPSSPAPSEEAPRQQTQPAPQQQQAPAEMPAIPSGDLTLVINVKSGTAQKRGITLSGRVGNANPVWLSDFSLADLQPLPPALHALLVRLGGGTLPAVKPATPTAAEPMKPAAKKKPAAQASAKRGAAKTAKTKAPAKAKGGAKKKAVKR